MYQERQVTEQALRVRVSHKRWAIIMSRSSCGSSSLACRLEVEVPGPPRLKIWLFFDTKRRSPSGRSLWNHNGQMECWWAIAAVTRHL